MTRTQQNMLNALCGDLERQIRMTADGRYVNVKECPQGMQVDKDSWRWIFVGTYKGWRQFPAIEGHGFVMVGASSRTLTVAECGDVVEMISAFGSERGVQWTEPEEQTA